MYLTTAKTMMKNQRKQEKQPHIWNTNYKMRSVKFVNMPFNLYFIVYLACNCIPVFG